MPRLVRGEEGGKGKEKSLLSGPSWREEKEKKALRDYSGAYPSFGKKKGVLFQCHAEGGGEGERETGHSFSLGSVHGLRFPRKGGKKKEERSILAARGKGERKEKK